MATKFTISILSKILVNAPLLLLFISVFNEFDFNYLNYKYFSFNFPFILIFYWSLKRIESLGYGYIFIPGLSLKKFREIFWFLSQPVYILIQLFF